MKQKYCLDDQLKKIDIGRACSTYKERKSAYRVWCGKLRKGDHLKDRGLRGRIILEWFFEKWVRGPGLDRSSSG
jgi:hypothetical protein